MTETKGKSLDTTTQVNTVVENKTTIPELLNLESKTIFSIRSALRKIIHETLLEAQRIESKGFYKLNDPGSEQRSKKEAEKLITETLQKIVNTLDILCEQSPQIATGIKGIRDKIANILDKQKNSKSKEFPQALRSTLKTIA